MSSVVVIGGGPGGYTAAIYCCEMGKKVTLVEQDGLGGAYLSSGCIPTRVFAQASHMYGLTKQMPAYGIMLDGAVFVDFEQTARFKRKMINEFTENICHSLTKAGVEVINGFGRLKNANTIEVVSGETKMELTADSVILACGGSDILVPGFEPDGNYILNSSHILNITTLPESLAIIGSGATGAEFASIMSTFGCRVTVIESGTCVLPLEDHDVSAALAESLCKRGVEILTETRAEGVVSKAGGVVTIALSDKAEQIIERRFNKVLVCAGRKPNVTGIGLDEAGVFYTKKFVETNDRMQTSTPNIYAVGDLTASHRQANIAYYEARIASLNIAGQDVRADYTAIPCSILSKPEISRVGLTEQAARERYTDVYTRIVPFSKNGNALIEQDLEGFIKIICDSKDNKPLGFSILGHKASGLISESTQALRFKLPAAAIANTIHPHPSISETLSEAAASIV